MGSKYNIDVFSEYSRFLRSTDVTVDSSGQKRVGTFDLSRLEKSKDDMYYHVDSSTELRLDLISGMFYGTTKLGWAIALANSKIELYDWPLAGDTIRIPSITAVQELI